MADLPRPAPSRRKRYTDGEIAALIAPVFGVDAEDLAFVILIQTPDCRCDGISNVEGTADFLREAIDMMPADG